jgi:hypothetical protein
MLQGKITGGKRREYVIAHSDLYTGNPAVDACTGVFRPAPARYVIRVCPVTRITMTAETMAVPKGCRSTWAARPYWHPKCTLCTKVPNLQTFLKCMCTYRAIMALYRPTNGCIAISHGKFTVGANNVDPNLWRGADPLMFPMLSTLSPTVKPTWASVVLPTRAPRWADIRSLTGQCRSCQSSQFLTPSAVIRSHTGQCRPCKSSQFLSPSDFFIPATWN